MAQIIHLCVRLMDIKKIPIEEFNNITSSLEKFRLRLSGGDREIYQDIVGEILSRDPTDPLFNEYLKSLIYFLVRRNMME